MAKKAKSNASAAPQANAPNYQQILLNQQPAHNPYYSDPTTSHLTQVSVPPPPYTPPRSRTISSSAANTVSMPQLNDISYPRVHSGSTPIVVQAPGIPYDHRAERYRHKVRSFNAQTIIIGILSIILALWSYSLFNQRGCIDAFVVHKTNNGVEVKFSDIRSAHLTLAYSGGFIILLCVLKSAIGFGGKSHGCYLFIIGLYALGMFMLTATLTYFVFYSPCTGTLSGFSTNVAKTLYSKLIDDPLPTPDRGLFGESNVVAKAQEDGKGLAIFVMDMLNTIFYFSIFISSTTLC